MAAVIGSLRADLTARIGEFQANMNKAADQTAGFANGFKRSAADAQRAASQITNSTKGIGSTTRDVERQIVASTSSIRRALLSTTSAFAAGFSVEAVRRSADTWTQYTNQLKVAGLEGENLAQKQQALYVMAQKNGVEVAGLGELYAKASQTADQLGASQTDLMRFVSGTTAALRIQGRGAQASAGAMLQLTQLLGGTKVQAQEYNSLIDGMYPLLQAVAAGSDRWGGSVARLTKDVKDSDVTVREFFDAALKGFGGLEQRAQRAQLTTSSSLQIIQNAWVKYIGQTDAALGASARFEQGMRSLANNIDEIVPALATVAVVMGAQFIGNLRIGEQNLNQFAGAQARATAELITGSRSLNEKAVAARQAALADQTAAMGEQWAAIATHEAAQANRDKLASTLALLTAEREEAEAALRGATNQRQRTIATRALVEARRAEYAVAKQVALAELEVTAAATAEAGARQRTAAATVAYTAAQRAASAAAMVAAGAARVLSGALAFFGGPIGLAITLVGIALVSLASGAQQAARAGEDARAALQEMQQSADVAEAKTQDLKNETKDLATATAESASKSRDAASAYDQQAISAANAAVHIRDMNAAQREAYALDLRKKRDDLSEQVSGQPGFLNGAFHTNQYERIRNAEDRLLRSYGYNRSGGRGRYSSDPGARREALAAISQQVRANPGSANTEQRAAFQERAVASAVVAANTQTVSNLTAAINEVEASIVNAPRGPTTPATPPKPTGAPPAAADDDKKNKGRGGGTSAAEKAERERLQQEANQREFDADLLRANEDLAEARAGLAVSAEEELSLALQRVENDRAVRAAQIAADGPTGAKKLSAAQAEQLTTLNEQISTQRRENLIAQSEVRLAEERLEQASLERTIQTDLLNAQAQVARTAGERRAIELRILDLQQQEERARLEAVIASKASTDAQKKLAQTRLDAMPAQYRAQARNVRNDTMGPMEAYMDSLNQSAGQVSESLQRAAADGFGALNDGLTDAIMNSKSLGEAFHDVAAQIIRDIVRIGVQQMIVKPLANWLFGGQGESTGGNTGGGFSWSKMLNVASSFFGGFRANGGDVMSGKAYMVGERGPEMFLPGANGSIIPNEALQSGSARGPSIVVYANDAVLTSWVERAVERGYRRAVGDAVPMAVRAARDVIPAEMFRDQNDAFI